MPTSEKRLAANRANAAKSTGPRTAEGKSRSRLNAVAHGLAAQTAVLPGEDPDQLEALSASLMKQLRPRGVVQRLVAERIVSLAWKLRRVARAEETIGKQMRQRRGESRFGRPHYKRDAADFLAEAIRDGGEMYLGEGCDTRLLRLTDYELRLDAALRAGVRELMRLQKDAGLLEEVEEDEPLATEPPAPEAAESQNVAPAEAETHDAPACENEPNADGADGGAAGEGDPGLGRAVPAACAAVPEDAAGSASAVETNPLPAQGETSQPDSAPEVTAVFPTGSSAPAPGTSSSPPLAPRP